jgi:Uma2 family endonuclease
MSRTSSLEIVYPESDGKPMAESDLHRDWMVRIIELLKAHFAGQRVYVSGNLLIYYVEGDPKKCVAPDVFVVKDCDPRRRKIYKLWEEGKPPNFVLETTSDSTQSEDLQHKMRLYARLGVAEYFLYDPLGDWLEPPLLGYRMVGGGYVPLEPDDQGGMLSEELGIIFRLENVQLVLIKAQSGEQLQTGSERAAKIENLLQEAEAETHEAEVRAQEAEARAKALEDELTRLRAERGQ